jgi:hypothetical protein
MEKPPAKPNSKRRPDRRKKPRGLNRFTEREVARAGRAGKAIGAERVEVDPATGRISIILPKSGRDAAASGSYLDDWMAKRGKDAHQA